MRPSSTLAKELTEREGFEIGQVALRISKLLMHKDVDAPCSLPKSPLLPPDLPPKTSILARPHMQ